MSFVEVDDLLSQTVDGVLEIGTNKRRVVTVLVRLLQIFFKVSSEFQLVFPPVKKRALERVAAGVGYVRGLPELIRSSLYIQQDKRYVPCVVQS